MSKSQLDIQSYQFALRIVLIGKEVTSVKKEFILTRQLVKSATSIGANIRESQQAQSTKDFISKLHISLKEANESRYWINLLTDSGDLQPEISVQLHAQLNSIISMLVCSIATSKKHIESVKSI